MQRVFLGWSRPALEQVVDYLWTRSAAGQRWDLSQVVVVLPGARAGRRLSERLAVVAGQRRTVYFPPEVTTVGQLPEWLYRCRQPFASPLTQQLAWTEALRETPAAVLREFVREIPATATDPRWWELGTLLWRQHRELAADGFDFRHVAAAGAQLAGFSEQARWQALAHVQSSYLERLDRLGLWDRQTARLFAIEHEECRTDHDLLLVGTVDLSRALRKMLDQVRARVTTLVHAEEGASDGFDAYGCLRPQPWLAAEIPLADDQIRVAEGPADQAAEVVRFLAELDGEYAASEIRVGIPDEQLVPLIQRGLAEAGVAARYGPGRRVEGTRPLRLLRGMVQYLDTGRLADLADLVRHPDLSGYLRAASDDTWTEVAALDDFCRQRLVETAAPSELAEDEGGRAASRLIARVGQLLRPLVGPPRLPADWVPAVIQVLTAVYGHQELDPDDPSDHLLLGGCEALRDALLELRRVPVALSRPVTAAEAVLMALSSPPRDHVPSAAETGGLELLGWLELPLDDAPVLVVTQLNENTIPTAANSDPFLPDTLRAHLGLNDNTRRYARDAYALSVLAHTRQRLAVIVGRRDDDANPLLPSRLLFATDDPRRRRRCLRLFGEGSTKTDDLTGGNAELKGGAKAIAAGPEMPARHRFRVPRPSEAVRLDTLNVTDFRAYLECPYRFYLTKILGLQSVQRPPDEMDGAAFGILVHEVLERFGQSAARDSDDAEEILRTLQQALQEIFDRRYGAAPRPALRIQQAQLKLRLEAFARQQAAWRQAGWRIVMTEGERRSVITRWDVDGEPVQLRGRIDRIDQHESGTYAILDYKSSEEGRTPREVHVRGAGRGPAGPAHWQDLQLPLYRHLAAELGLTSPVKLGFVTLPRALDQGGFLLADWTVDELLAADEAARGVIRKIRGGEFWEPEELDAGLDPGLDRICQVRVFDRQLESRVVEGAGIES